MKWLTPGHTAPECWGSVVHVGFLTPAETGTLPASSSDQFILKKMMGSIRIFKSYRNADDEQLSEPYKVKPFQPAGRAEQMRPFLSKHLRSKRTNPAFCQAAWLERQLSSLSACLVLTRTQPDHWLVCELGVIGMWAQRCRPEQVWSGHVWKRSLCPRRSPATPGSREEGLGAGCCWRLGRMQARLAHGMVRKDKVLRH